MWLVCASVCVFNHLSNIRNSVTKTQLPVQSFLYPKEFKVWDMMWPMDAFLLLYHPLRQINFLCACKYQCTLGAFMILIGGRWWEPWCGMGFLHGWVSVPKTLVWVDSGSRVVSKWWWAGMDGACLVLQDARSLCVCLNFGCKSPRIAVTEQSELEGTSSGHMVQPLCSSSDTVVVTWMAAKHHTTFCSLHTIPTVGWGREAKNKCKKFMV